MALLTAFLNNGAPYFHFALVPENYVTDPVYHYIPGIQHRVNFLTVLDETPFLHCLSGIV